MAIDAQAVKALREETGLPMMKCKEALAQARGDAAKAKEILRKQGFETAARRAGRATAAGAVGAYIHFNGRVGVLVEAGCETDFVAHTEDFKGLIKDLAMHIAFADPAALSRDEIDPTLVESERAIYREQAKGKPPQAIDKIVEGKLKKFYAEKCLLEQPFSKDTSKTISDVLTEVIGRTGENIAVKRFVRFEVGA